MASSFQRTLYIMMFLLVLLLVLDIGLRIASHSSADPYSSRVIVPKQFVIRYPDCAQKLIEIAGLENIYVGAMENQSDKLVDFNAYDLPP